MQIEELRALAARQLERHDRESKEAAALAALEREKLRNALAAAAEDAGQLRTSRKNLGIAVEQLELRLDAADRRAALADDKRAAAEREAEAAREKHAGCHARDRDAQREIMHLRADGDRLQLELERCRAQVALL